MLSASRILSFSVTLLENGVVEYGDVNVAAPVVRETRITAVRTQIDKLSSISVLRACQKAVRNPEAIVGFDKVDAIDVYENFKRIYLFNVHGDVFLTSISW